MFKEYTKKIIIVIMLMLLSIGMEVKAEINFDFALPLFKQNEVNFEKTKPTDYNFQLLKKYILEHDGNVLAQYHAIVRWFSLIKLSDTPRHDELINVGNKYFSTVGKKNPTTEERLREIFYKGVLLSIDKTEDPESKKDQEFEDILLNNEEELHENPDYWIAKGILFQVLKNRPTNYFNMMKPEEDLKIALTLIPRTAHYYYVIGQCFRFLGKADSALFLSIASYEKAASLDPRNQKLQNSLLGIYMGLHEEYQAQDKHEPFWLEEAVYKKILEMSPGNPHALNNLGYLYAEYGVNTKTAEELCLKAVELAPENAGFYDSLGWAAFKNKDYQLAKDSLQKSISLRNNVYDSHYHLATVYYTNMEYDEAAKQYQEAIELKPDSAEALNNLAYLYTERNIKTQEAITMAEAAIKIEPNNPSYLDTLGWAHYRNGDLQKSLMYLQKADKIAPAQGEILLHIGRVNLDLNNFETALTYTKEAFKADPGMNDPDETLYLTIRLKAYHEALGDYHGLLGEKADKEKVLSILTGISRLYQEEGLYDKSIEITKICSELKNGTRTLKEPLLDSYKLNKTEEKTTTEIKSTEENGDEEILEPEEEIPEEETSDNQLSEAINAPERHEEEANILPEAVDYPVAVSFCPEFFKNLTDVWSGFSGFKEYKITLILDRMLFPEASAIIRISSTSLSGEDIKNTVMQVFGCDAAEKEDIGNASAPEKLSFASGVYYCTTLSDSVYLCKKEIPLEKLEKLKGFMPNKNGYLMEFYYDNNVFHSRFPELISKLIPNPFEPFERFQTIYKFNERNLNEFTIGSTGNEENEDFIKKFAKRLFDFKLEAKKQNLETTIKLKVEKGLVYISTDFEDPVKWFTDKVDLVTRLINNFTSGFLKLSH